VDISEKFYATANRNSEWYELFSRGARDWLRHNEKIREAVRDQLTELLPQANIVDEDGPKRVKIPIKFLEHYRFTLNQQDERNGVGQGPANPNDILRPPRDPTNAKGEGGNDGGGIEFVLDVAIDDIVDWLWEELELPNLEQKSGTMDEEQYSREGWNRRGVRSRLDRRRSLKESIKRRSIQKNAPAVINDDLRFRQLVQRRQPNCQAVVFFLMDVSASMTARDRQLAKTFFFWVVQGLRRQYSNLECEFIAHTDRAWRFSENEFFEVKGSGGTVASRSFELVEQSIASDYDPGKYNIYIFYASDGENYPLDHAPAIDALRRLLEVANFSGFVETRAVATAQAATEMERIFAELEQENQPVSQYFLHEDDEVWEAIKLFFQQSVDRQEA
jgi:uncharacterized sporulation protein YeaH/YhbH (DUF444 family)